MNQPAEHVVIGQLGAVYGVKGWLKIQSYTDDVEAIFDYHPWQIRKQGKVQEVQVEEWRRHNKGLIAKLAGVDDRDAAHLMTGADIIIEAEQLPELPEDEFYWRDLIGMTVVNTDGYNMGVVDQLMATASNDVMVVKANSNDAFGRSERLIPFIQSQYIQEVDKVNKRIVVDWPSDF
ncbi:MAG: ribosome maturation factor RimM [Idiomarinaceae bacterium]|jgi:16S rRNA processing protein RimM|uniref:ribosome maturation factor RimM n=1 Tax=Pseudidiomarina aquimaris TaxID=641841 RepID=UPI000C585617|nr:ribosome maturation factor RimM [Idiomarinaceae bacterium]|tara:strand:+ start:4074 stop:4604 length:531 start_codon:yes stop_codon:yes gene_type:complete